MPQAGYRYYPNLPRGDEDNSRSSENEENRDSMHTELPSHSLFTEEDGYGEGPPPSWRRPSSSLYPRCLMALLVLSCMINTFQFARKDSCQERVMPQRSKYAELAADLTLPFEWATDYASTNLTLSGELWENINFDKGMVALPNEWTDSKQLPRAQAFPWDHKQGLYILNGFHVIHCLKSIHRAIREYEGNQPQTLPLAHLTHCLDNLRSDALCQADDTPRYTSISWAPGTAIGQVRQCKDWNKLEEFSRDHNACYRYMSAAADSLDQFERFKYCPKDSPYWPKVREHFGKGEGWQPE